MKMMKSTVGCCIIIVLNIFMFTFGSISTIDPKKWLENVDYNANVMPNAEESTPLIVDTQIYVLNIGQISEITMSFEIDFYVAQIWHDPRLVLTTKDDNVTIKTNLYEGLDDLLWQPDTYFPTAYSVNGIQSDPKSSTHKRSLQWWPNGQLLKTERNTLQVRCPMYLVLYPFDRQICHLSLESYLHPIPELIYVWNKNNPVKIDPEMKMSEMTLSEFRPIVRNISYPIIDSAYYSRLECCFFFERRIGYYVLLLFLPTMVTASLTWISLTMSKSTSFSDIMQIILSLIMLNFFRYQMMPKADYIKADDIFVQCCFLLVFISLLKIGFEKCFHKEDETNDDNKCDLKTSKITPDQEQLLDENIKNDAKNPANLNRTYKKRLVSKKVCNLLWTILLPTLFLIFCIVYFSVYLLVDNYQGDSICRFKA